MCFVVPSTFDSFWQVRQPTAGAWHFDRVESQVMVMRKEGSVASLRNFFGGGELPVEEWKTKDLIEAGGSSEQKDARVWLGRVS